MESPRPDALIETIHVAPDGTIALWAEHVRRLTGSAAALGFASVPIGLEDRVHAAAAALTTAVTPSSAFPSRGESGWRLRLLYAPDGSASIETAVLPSLIDKPRLAWAREQLNAARAGVLDSTEPLLRQKTTHRPWYTQATAWLAAHPEVFDLLYVNERGAVCEGSRTNVYARIDGVWLTPPLEDGCLPGTVRSSLLARNLVSCATLTPADIEHAECLRLSNGLRGWFDVVLTA